MSRRKRIQIRTGEKHDCLYHGAYGTLNIPALMEVELAYKQTADTNDKDYYAIRILFSSNTTQPSIIDVYESCNVKTLEWMISKRTDILVGFEHEDFDRVRNLKGWSWPKCSKQFGRQEESLQWLEEEDLSSVGC